ncbi:MAG: hypothetical protein A3E80_03670 [Chlamydiae bacterium RIFCSPHIGHO2_12_FULL_49_9]|nr:MAG: hypothetical protein A3E80_03670 [Chlamydiae bacterium RIFCSPHIGHO2_12_FULL_49_9]
MYKKLLFCLLASSIYATVNEPLRWQLSSGYRNDRIHWHLQNPGDESAIFYTELYRNVQFWENSLTLRVISRDLMFFLRGSYGAFGRGELSQHYEGLAITQDQPQFEFDTSGWSADGSGYFGYAVNLTDGRTYKVILTPLIGYSGHFEQLSRKNPSPNPYLTNVAEGANFLTMYSSLPNQLKMAWYGLFLGVGFIIEPGDGFVFNAGYAYNWLNARTKTTFQYQADLGSPVVSSDITTYKMKAVASGNLGQTGWAQLDYMIAKFWRMGVGAEVRYFSTQVLTTKLKSTVQELFPDPSTVEGELAQKFKLRWTAISGWFQISREF